jgi:membrane-associated phospholipid phosphatase
MIILNPTRLDLWFIARLAGILGKHPLFDVSVREAIRYDVLGGLWFAAALFLVCTQSTRADDGRSQRRLLTIFFGSVLAIVLTLIVGAIFHWLPPNQDPRLAHLYPSYLDKNTNMSSFPSQETALCSAIAAGIYSLRRSWGTSLWFAVIAFVGLPRIYVGGHFPSDIVAGIACGMIGYRMAYYLETPFSEPLRLATEENAKLRSLAAVILFLWIIQVGTGFRMAEWIRDSVSLYATPSLLAPANELCIGGDTVFGQYFEGAIDEVKIYSRALSQAEIQKDLNTPISHLSEHGSRLPGLVAAYSFDEGTGTVAIDASGNANNGIIRRAIWTTHGKFGNALLFDGARALVTIRDSPALHFTSGLTLEAWVDPSIISARWRDVIYKEVDAYFLEATDPYLDAVSFGGAFRTRSMSSPSSLTPNTWTHIAGTFDGIVSRLYINGILVTGQ